MGYSLSSLAKLPYDKNTDFYIFFIGGNAYYKGGVMEKLLQNFDVIAREIGPDAVIAKGFNPREWTLQLSEKYFKDVDGLYNYFPGIMITDSHPDDFKEDSLRILLSLNHIEEKFNGIEHFFDLLINFVTKQDEAFIQYAKGNIHWIDRVNETVDLKPNIMGFGINLNALLALFKKDNKAFIYK